MSAKKRETKFSDALHRGLNEGVYVEKTNNLWRRGVPDFYYEGNRGIVWSEHKVLYEDEVPMYPVSAPSLPFGDQWPLQYRWLMRAGDNGHVAWVLCGILKRGNTFEVAGVIWLPYPFDYRPMLHASELDRAKHLIELYTTNDVVRK